MYNKPKSEVLLFTQEEIALLDEAISKWGVESQTEMIEEECLELALAIQKSKRVGGRMHVKNFENIIDEIADVSIMIMQARRMFPEDMIEKRIRYKLERLKKRLDGDTH